MTDTIETLRRLPEPLPEPWPAKVWLGGHMFQNSYDDGSYYCYELRASIKFADRAALAALKGAA